MSYNGKKVLVTGADGFIGSHLTEALVREGAEVRAFCLYNSMGSLGWLDRSEASIRRSLNVTLGDIRDPQPITEACRGVDVVFHLAALIAIPYSYVAPASFTATNVCGTQNVLEAVRKGGVGRLVNTSTSEVYGTPDTLPIRETHPLRGQSPYSASKIGADKLCEAYFSSFEVPVVTLRPFNTYGPRQSSRAVIPTILVQLLAGATELSLGSLAPRRDLTFVEDTVRGFLAAGTAPSIEGETIQLGTGRAESIKTIVDLAVALTGREVAIRQDAQRVRPEKSEVMVLQSDPSRAESRLGWKASTSLEDGLRKTMSWLSQHLGHYRHDQYAI